MAKKQRTSKWWEKDDLNEHIFITDKDSDPFKALYTGPPVWKQFYYRMMWALAMSKEFLGHKDFLEKLEAAPLNEVRKMSTASYYMRWVKERGDLRTDQCIRSEFVENCKQTEETKTSLMYILLCNKFEEDKEAKALLLSTGRAILHEQAEPGMGGFWRLDPTSNVVLLEEETDTLGRWLTIIRNGMRLEEQGFFDRPFDKPKFFFNKQ
jgi:predicted NAD-dependent protein-ADP-ribosyltransferase YbiA (DUF1768 family)